MFDADVEVGVERIYEGYAGYFLRVLDGVELGIEAAEGRAGEYVGGLYARHLEEGV